MSILRRNAIIGSRLILKINEVKAFGGSNPSSSAISSRILRMSKEGLLKEISRCGISINSMVVENITLDQSKDMLIFDGIVIKNRNGPTGENVKGLIVVDEERDE